MNEFTESLNVSEVQVNKFNFTTIQTKLVQCANVSSVPSSSGDATIYRWDEREASHVPIETRERIRTCFAHSLMSDKCLKDKLSARLHFPLRFSSRCPCEVLATSTTSLFLSSSFSGQTIASKALVLITIQLNIPKSTVNLTINSDRLVLATMLLKDIKQTLATLS